MASVEDAIDILKTGRRGRGGYVEPGAVKRAITALEASQAPTRARPVVLVQVSGGIAESTTYGDVESIVIDWDNVEGESYEEAQEDYSASRYVLEVIADLGNGLPGHVRATLQDSYDRARRWDEYERPTE